MILDAHVLAYFGDVPAATAAPAAIPAGLTIHGLQGLFSDALASGRFGEAEAILIELRIARDAAAIRNAAALAVLADGTLQPAPYAIPSR